MNFIEETDLAWAAGFFDGEGCVEAYFAVNNKRQVKNLSTSLRAHNCDIRPLLRLQEIFGGIVRVEREARGNRSAIWVWKISGPESEEVAFAMIPYSSVKVEQLGYYVKLRELIGGTKPCEDEIAELREDLVGKIRFAKKARLP